ncbi:beta-galactosidase [Nesterenkonia halotolerans]|uniref:Beta-galactosidase n=1 Tax=Nesterenkonia halotolerans TaxID=225325 RepID=A0ABR9J7B6_9MICC|nr:beta-galactosidase [Nesterenkonia halotolerans]MBE1514891.1 beta-galactosidase [Nesterenkonia halotolerans]
MTSPTRQRSKILYGGDYNPEQWGEETWSDDYTAFSEASIDTLTLNVFAWSHLQPAEDTFDFTRLDRSIEQAVAHGKKIVLATATGALPPWLAHQYPEVTRVDFEGRKHVYGQRHNHCPSSPVFARLSKDLAGRIAERYAGTEGLIAWHIGNEYGGACYCSQCAAGFRVWLRERYGSLDRLNDAWNSMFWSHLFTDFEEIEPPNALSEHWKGPNHTAFQGITLDYLRFMSDAMLKNYRTERDAIRDHDPDTPATTNFMGLFRPIDYHRWAEDLDFVSWDNYPPGQQQFPRMALAHDLMRGLKGGQPFWVMEQTPTITASRDVNPVKRPGVLRAWSWQSVAHGADAVLYFQMRQSKGACEKYHGAVLDHAGRRDTRAFKEVAELGGEFETVGKELTGGRTPARTALVFDWDSWWLAESTDGFNRHVKYPDVVLRYYEALWQANIDVDVVASDADLSGYDLVVAPLLYVLKGSIAQRLEQVVERGGSVVANFWSGRADEDGNAHLMDAPGPLSSMMGVRVEETDSAHPGETNPVELRTSTNSPTFSDAELVMELLVPEGAEVMGTYQSDFYSGRAAVTKNAHPSGGEAWYVGTDLDLSGVSWVLREAAGSHDLVGPYQDYPDLELCVRVVGLQRFSFVINHSSEARSISIHTAGTDLLTGRRFVKGEKVGMDSQAVLVVREE